MAIEEIRLVENAVAKRIRALPMNWQLDALRLIESIQAKHKAHKRLERERRETLTACASMRASAEQRRKVSEWMAERKTEWKMQLDAAVDAELQELNERELSNALRLIERLHEKYERRTLTLRKWGGSLKAINGEYTSVELRRKASEWMAEDAAKWEVCNGV